MNVKQWTDMNRHWLYENIVEPNGITLNDTFFDDFSIADFFQVYGVEKNSVKETYNRCMKEWKHDYKYLTGLVMALNWKIWFFYQYAGYIEKSGEECPKGYLDNLHKMQNLYGDLYEKADTYATTHLTGDELDYFYRTTD